MSTQVIRWIFHVIRSAVERFYWDNGFSKAASLAYTSLISLVPITFLGFGFLASFAVSNQDLLKVREFIFRQFVPNQQTVSTILEELSKIDQALNSSSFSVLAIVFFGVTALLLINSIEYALNETWQVFEPRSIAQRISIFCAILVITPILLVSAYYTTKLRIEPFLMGIEALQPFSEVYNHVVSFLIDGAAFFMLFFLIPKAPVKVNSALFGAFITALLFGVAKYYFTFYLVHFTSYDKIYGAVAVIPIFLFWLYLTWTIILFGCEVSYQFQHLPISGKIWKKQVTSIGDGALLLAIQTLILIGKSFYCGSRGMTELSLCEKLGTSSIVIKPIIGALKKSGIVLQADGIESLLVCAKDPKIISVEEIQRSLLPPETEVHLPLELSLFFSSLHPKADSKSVSLESLILLQSTQEA
jgi:YihY family inner membrane protein